MSGAIGIRFDEAAIDAIFADLDQAELPGAAVGIAIGGVPIYRKGFGLANMELPTRLVPDMRMRIGSTTKHFTCLAYMLLCEEGLAGIDDPIGRHVPGLDPVTARATMRQLMSHSSGIRDPLWITLAMHGPNRPVTDHEMLAYYATVEDADFEPDTHWSYNNGGYALLSAAIEGIAGRPLEEVLRDRIFVPVGMHDTLLRRWDSDFVPNSATLHYRDARGVFSKTRMGMELGGTGGMVSTMDDMLLWLKHMDAPVVGSSETWRMMCEPYRLVGGHSTGYGLGLIVETYRGVEILHHAGDVMSGNSQMLKVPAAGLDISIGVNRGDVSSLVLALRVVDTVVEGLAPLLENPAYDRRAGTFFSERDGRVVSLSVKDDLHLLSIDGGAGLPVAPDADGVLQLPAPAAFLQQTVRADGDNIVLSEFGREDRLVEIETDGEAMLGERAGTYRSEAIDATLTLIEEEDGPVARTHGRHGQAVHRLIPITADIWRFEQCGFPQVSGILTLAVDGSGLRIDLARLRRLSFARIA